MCMILNVLVCYSHWYLEQFLYDYHQFNAQYTYITLKVVWCHQVPSYCRDQDRPSYLKLYGILLADQFKPTYIFSLALLT